MQEKLEQRKGKVLVKGIKKKILQIDGALVKEISKSYKLLQYWYMQPKGLTVSSTRESASLSVVSFSRLISFLTATFIDETIIVV